MTVAAPAKINLFLDITGKRNDGYHLIATVMQAVSLCDDVTVIVDRDSEEIRVSCSEEEIPSDCDNIAYRAAQAFFRDTGAERTGLQIRIKKRIPWGAGMAGGSADAAAVLFALNELFEQGLTTEELAEIGESVGADVPFCLYGGTMSAAGIGTILSPLPDMPDCTLLIVKPDFKISTKEAYERSDGLGYDFPKNMQGLTDAVCNGRVEEIGKHLYNKFEEIVDQPEIEEIKHIMKRFGALGAVMTGSGSAVFGIYDDKDKANDALSELWDRFPTAFLTEPVSHGPQKINPGFLASLLS